MQKASLYFLKTAFSKYRVKKDIRVNSKCQLVIEYLLYTLSSDHRLKYHRDNDRETINIFWFTGNLMLITL